MWSRYNFLMEISAQGNILYNSYSNTLIRLDGSLYNDLKKLEDCKWVTTEELSSFSEEEIDYFQKSFVLVKDDETLVELMQHQSMSRLYNRKHLVLTVAPTQACNFACSYCYENWRKSGSMDERTENALIGYLEQQQKEHALESVSLNWYGGEPLLAAKRIESLGKRIKATGLRLDENEIITNGYYFTGKNIRMLSEIGVTSVQITLDGFAEIHDQRRPLINGEGTFSTILRNLDDYYNGKYRDTFLIALRINVDKRNYGDYLKIYSWLKERYPSERLVVYPGWIHLDENSRQRSVCFSRNEITDFCLDLYKRYQIVSERMFPEDVNMECLARSPYSMLIGWQGEIYKCFEELGDRNFIVGNINDETIWHNYELLARYAVGIDHYQDPECRICKYLPICHGGCPKRRLENKYQGYSNECCTPFKARLEDYIQLYLL